MRVLLAIALPGLTSFLCCCASRDASDLREVRRHFALPEDTPLLQYTGYPSMVGFGQREGLQIQAVFQLPEARVEEIARVGERTGWRKLPVAPEILAKLPFTNTRGRRINIPFPAAGGYYLCKTVGSDVLYADERGTYLCENHAGTLRCEAMDSRKCRYSFSDQILGVLIPREKKLYTFIGSTY